jgi:hypothetical protein
MEKHAISKLPKNATTFIRDRGGQNFNGVRMHVSLIRDIGASAMYHRNVSAEHSCEWSLSVFGASIVTK